MPKGFWGRLISNTPGINHMAFLRFLGLSQRVRRCFRRVHFERSETRCIAGNTSLAPSLARPKRKHCAMQAPRLPAQASRSMVGETDASGSITAQPSLDRSRFAKPFAEDFSSFRLALPIFGKGLPPAVKDLLALFGADRQQARRSAPTWQCAGRRRNRKQPHSRNVPCPLSRPPAQGVNASAVAIQLKRCCQPYRNPRPCRSATGSSSECGRRGRRPRACNSPRNDLQHGSSRRRCRKNCSR